VTDSSESPAAVILAAGRGSRMGVITETLPKPLVPILGRPALQWVVDGLVDAGVRKFVIVTGYLSEQVRGAMDGYRPDEITMGFVEQDQQLGTAHAMRLTREAVAGAPVVLAFADIMTSPGNFVAMIDRFNRNKCALVGGVRDVGDPWRAAAVYVDDEFNIQRIIEKPAPGSSTTPWAHAGLYCFVNGIYDYIEKVQPSARGEYEITDAVSMMIADGLRCQAQKLTGYWKDLATPEDVAEAETMMCAAIS